MVQEGGGRDFHWDKREKNSKKRCTNVKGKLIQKIIEMYIKRTLNASMFIMANKSGTVFNRSWIAVKGTLQTKIFSLFWFKIKISIQFLGWNYEKTKLESAKTLYSRFFWVDGLRKNPMNLYIFPRVNKDAFDIKFP